MEEVVIQDPETAESAYMPRSAIAAVILIIWEQ
jgi:hypothetical protein